ncbi:hypothetical protein GUJ93_ZPchr0001g32318 [Zizania palustris]|uniref:Uncharacterized protein n=1 Tax=Zizania palustris TaxID=103762 RepID=A0A8J5V9X5_ZIZPA|nr:hypothetical protein GUJ93_ZPchr0001g32318 [Zizania palustris]
MSRPSTHDHCGTSDREEEETNDDFIVTTHKLEFPKFDALIARHQWCWMVQLQRHCRIKMSLRNLSKENQVETLADDNLVSELAGSTSIAMSASSTAGSGTRIEEALKAIMKHLDTIEEKLQPIQPLGEGRRARGDCLEFWMTTFSGHHQLGRTPTKQPGRGGMNHLIDDSNDNDDQEIPHRSTREGVPEPSLGQRRR